MITRPNAPLPTPRSDDDDEEETTTMRQPVVDSKLKEDRLNPPVEYDVKDLVDLDPTELKDKLNELGKDGWALMATTPYFVFRRMKKQDEEKPKARVGFGLG